MVAPQMLLTQEAAELVGIEVASWRSYVSRGDAPRADEYVGTTPRWRKSTVVTWLENRPGRGHGGGRPPKDADVEATS